MVPPPDATSAFFSAQSADFAGAPPQAVFGGRKHSNVVFAADNAARSSDMGFLKPELVGHGVSNMSPNSMAAAHGLRDGSGAHNGARREHNSESSPFAALCARSNDPSPRLLTGDGGFSPKFLPDFQRASSAEQAERELRLSMMPSRIARNTRSMDRMAVHAQEAMRRCNTGPGCTEESMAMTAEPSVLVERLLELEALLIEVAQVGLRIKLQSLALYPASKEERRTVACRERAGVKQACTNTNRNKQFSQTAGANREDGSTN